ncbi:Mevalonate kinase [Nocardia seriolae]|uniref:mevalonate kinase n=2 Tax=Nocardia seriolae TaxID=37332 RepID=A0ABC8B4E3_9NOCA|nr:Mevalonate kinase [Nocardia seriolae]OJF82356.1 mevalonate kinase [Nocardia seriolae]
MDWRRFGIGRAHAKVILFGEHAVVYGAPAVAVPVPELAVNVTATRSADSTDCQVLFSAVEPDMVDRLTTPEKDLLEPAGQALRLLVANCLEVFEAEDSGVDLVIDCGIPTARGLGSSAACARAVVRALADLFDRKVDEKTCFELVQFSERLAHGTPSGVDAAATGAVTPILFRRGSSMPLTWGFDGVFVIADSGLASSTCDAVTELRERFDRDSGRRAYFIAQATRLAMGALRDIEKGSLPELGSKLTENHELLRDVGLSTADVDRLVVAAIGAGARGGKVTGGGTGGCVVALADDVEAALRISAELRSAGADATWMLRVRRPAAPAVNRRTWI